MKAISTASTTQIIVNVDNVALINKIKNAIKMIQGVGKIHIAKPTQVKSCQLDEALHAAHNEPLYETNDLDELMESLKS